MIICFQKCYDLGTTALNICTCFLEKKRRKTYVVIAQNKQWHRKMRSQCGRVKNRSGNQKTKAYRNSERPPRNLRKSFDVDGSTTHFHSFFFCFQRFSLCFSFLFRRTQKCGGKKQELNFLTTCHNLILTDFTHPKVSLKTWAATDGISR